MHLATPLRRKATAKGEPITNPRATRYTFGNPSPFKECAPPPGPKAPAQTVPRYWLFKTEPSAFSFEQLREDGTTPWTGVRNFQKRATT